MKLFNTALLSASAGGGAPNNAPTVTVPSAQSMQWNSTLTLESPDAILISDSDSDSQTVMLTATHGTLTLASTTGLSFSVGDGTADATMTFSGTLANVNAALDGLQFIAETDYAGSAGEIAIATDDGHGGTDSQEVTINVQCVRTLVLGTSADFYAGNGQGFKLQTTYAGPSSTFIEIASSPEDTAAAVFSVLNTLTGGNVNNCTGSVDEGGDQNIVVVFEAGYGTNGAGLSYHSAQWHPTITLTEAVTQQGVADVKEEFSVGGVVSGTVTFSDVDDHYGSIDCDEYGFITAMSIDNITSVYEVISGGIDSGYVWFRALSAGNVPHVTGSTVNLQVDGVTGQPEIHTITPTPRTPTGGNLTVAGATRQYNEIAVGWDGYLGGNWTTSGTFDAGAVTFTSTANTNWSDTALSPVNVDLTAPEMAHSIT